MTADFYPVVSEYSVDVDRRSWRCFDTGFRNCGHRALADLHGKIVGFID